jgi:hypothetical protein
MIQLRTESSILLAAGLTWNGDVSVPLETRATGSKKIG